MEGDFQVGAWLIQPKLNSISGDGKTVHVEPKVMEVLVCLAGHPSEVVEKERLIRAVWADTFVTDDVLTHAIAELRKTFGDDAQSRTSASAAFGCSSRGPPSQVRVTS